MILPILISVSLAPGSYFFCAFADVANAAADINDTKATRLVRRNMLTSRLFFAECGKPRAGWQGCPYSARRNGLLRAADCGEYARIWTALIRGGSLGSSEISYRTALSLARRCGLSLGALARAQDDGQGRLPRARRRLRQ